MNDIVEYEHFAGLVRSANARVIGRQDGHRCPDTRLGQSVGHPAPVFSWLPMAVEMNLAEPEDVAGVGRSVHGTDVLGGLNYERYTEHMSCLR